MAVSRNKLKYMGPWDPKSPEEWAEELHIGPMEPLMITRRTYDRMLGDMPYRTVETCWKGLHWVDARGIGRVLSDMSKVMDSGPEMGATIVADEHREFTREEALRNHANLQEVGNQILRDAGIW